MPKPEAPLLEVLRRNRARALEASGAVGRRKLLRLLEAADRDLTRRLARVPRATGGPGRATFTGVQLEAARRQVRDVVRVLTRGLGGLVVDQGLEAADASVGNLLDYLGRAERAFRGVGARPLPFREASVLDEAVSGTETSILRRLASGPEGTPGKVGILERYGVETIGAFEEAMQVGLLARKDWADVRSDLVERSPFLEGKPKHWAERILRTESMHAQNRSAWEAQRAANEELGDLVKVNVAVFDDRTASDSYSVHGQIRRNEEPFDTWFGPVMHPPDRPNDRATFVPHRISWPIPTALRWRSDGEVAARWRAEGRKGSPPPRPRLTTVPIASFGRSGA